MLKVFLLCIAFFSTNSFSKEDIVHGPFGFDDYSIYIKSENDIDYPLGLYLTRDGGDEKIDSYEMNGDIPNVDAVFFIRLNEVNTLIILISWRKEHRAEKISGNLYEVYGYSFSGEKLVPNMKVMDDPNMIGVDGEFNGDKLSFKYKDAASIKEYLRSKYP